MSDSHGDITLDREELLGIFVTSAAEILTEIEEALSFLETSPTGDEHLKAVLRGLHTLKGNASSIALNEMAQFCHVLEDPFIRVREGALTLTAPLVRFLLGGIDTLRELVRFEAEAPLVGAASGGPVGAALGNAHGGIRVPSHRADRMLALVAELAIARVQINELLRRGTPEELQDALLRYGESERLHTELEDIVMKLRMIELPPVLRLYRRAVRDAAAQCSKRATLVVDADGVELDGAIVDQLRDPLLHMVRNAIDHGIEPPDVRIACGKDPVGRVVIRAFHDAGSVLVQVEDDGAGIDRARVLASARRRGMTALDHLRDEEVYRLVLEPGFSTAETVTEISGRGVGLDVVLRSVNALRGRIDIERRAGGGTIISIRLPLTLAIIEGFAVEAANETFIIPSGAVEEFVNVRAARNAGGTTPAPFLGVDLRKSGILRWRDSAIPLINLAHLFGLEDTTPGADAGLVIVQHAGGRAALTVDAIHGASRSVIRPLSGLTKTNPGIAASTIVGRGRVAFVLDVPSLVKRARTRPEPSAA